ncbi:hypothetical protein CK203_060924 [Vitis vinifera]|uniref:Retrotransposon gag domain-containing protein n=1 Tax=Vitis vinifera TaxID=29760 RepID=A0A438GGN1_VITVI|nr:hypothetical protein CK203_060924 [Vitis vinifera]
MCGGNDHFAWKHPIFLKVCKGLRIVEGGVIVTNLGSSSWIRVGGSFSYPWPNDRWAASPIGPSSGGLAEDEADEEFRWSHYYGGFDGAPMASLLTKFRMPKIERYTSIGYSCMHLRLYSIVIRAHRLYEARMDLGWLSQKFLRSFAFNTVVDVSRKELQALRQRLEKSITSFTSRLREKIAQIIDCHLENEQISMIMRSLQPKFARHLMGFTHTDFGSLGKKPLGEQRLGDVSTISSVGLRPPRRYQIVGQTSGAYYLPPYVQYKPPAPSRPMTPTYLHPVL